MNSNHKPKTTLVWPITWVIDYLAYIAVLSAAEYHRPCAAWVNTRVFFTI